MTVGLYSEALERKAVDAFRRYLEICNDKKKCDANNVVVAEYFTTQRPLIYGAC